MTAAAQPLVSVLTPVYNGEKYLAECIESVLAQTYHHWEYIIVNNCSSDRTLAIAQAYAARDARIRVQTNAEFVGVIANHNIAFRQIAPHSSYTKVLHADDRLFPECLERMVALAEAHSSVGLVSAYRLHGTHVDLDGLPYPSPVVPGHEVCRRALLEGLHVFGSPSATLIRSDLVRRQAAFYNEANLHADTEACYALLQHSDLGFVHQVLTFSGKPVERISTTAARLNSYLLANLRHLLRYGPVYLSAAEYQQRLHAKLNQYYAYLGESVLQRRDRQFWQYHRREFAALGLQLDQLRIVRAALAALLDRLLNPKRTIENGLYLVRQRLQRKLI